MESNSIFENLVERILLDLFEAQKASNQASAKLLDSFLHADLDNTLDQFPIPNSCIRSFDFSLKFLLEDLGGLLAEDFISQIYSLMEKTWEEVIKKLYRDRKIDAAHKKKLQKVKIIEEMRPLKFKNNKSNNKDIAKLIVEQVMSIFEQVLKNWNLRKIDIVGKAFNNLETEINTILFGAKNNGSIPLSKLNATFDLEKLNALNEDMLCSINVNVEMRNFETAYTEGQRKSNPLLVLK